MALVTIEQAIAHLRLDGLSLVQEGSPLSYVDPRATDLVDKMELASSVILDYLKIVQIGSPPELPDWTSQDKKVVEAATLFALSALYDDDNNRTLEDYMKPTGVITLLLMRLRTPALA